MCFPRHDLHRGLGPMLRILIVLTGWELAMTKCHVCEEYTVDVLEAGS